MSAYNPLGSMKEKRYALDLIIAARNDNEAEKAIAEVVDHYNHYMGWVRRDVED